MISIGPLFFKKFSYGKNAVENGHRGVPTWHTYVDTLFVSSPVQRALFVV